MNSTSTHYLIRHLYGETEPTENEAIKDALNINRKLWEEYEALKSLHKMMSSVKVSPSPSLLKKIMRYSRESSTEPAV